MKYFGECNDCGKKFRTREEFSNHFTRDDNANITGCHKIPPKATSKSVN